MYVVLCTLYDNTYNTKNVFVLCQNEKKLVFVRNSESLYQKLQYFYSIIMMKERRLSIRLCFQEKTLDKKKY